ncbi:sensor histidine kinase [Notoacmeibacter marinus]|nr:sensor histidine kinase [Notoacmeibacter marinus]
MLTDFSPYMPHGMCLLWEPWLLLLWGGSDLLIFISYFLIPLALLKVLSQRPDLNHRRLVLLFVSFIALCGLTHAVSIVTLWYPIYPLQGFLKLATGLVSAVTAIVLFRLVPRLVSIPTPSKLQEANERLQQEIASHEATLAKLRLAQQNLEAEVEERTADLSRANAKLAVTTREAVHRSRNLIAVVSSIARQSARHQTDTESFIDTLVGRFNSLANATATVIEGDSNAAADLRAVVRRQLEPVELTYGDRVHVSGPPIDAGSEAAQQISLALHELATNSQKYGALSTDAGTIRISWEKAEPSDGNEDQLMIRWREDLPKTVGLSHGAVEKGGFGSRLLLHIVPTILQGRARRSMADGTLSYELTVPLAAMAGGMNRKGDASLAARIAGRDFGVA